MRTSPFACLMAASCLFVAGVVSAQEARQEFAQIKIDVAFVEYKLADVEPLVREQRVSVESLKELWAKGQGRLLGAPSVVTKSGQEAVAKSVTELTYPTECTFEPAGGQGAAASTNAVVSSRIAALVPSDFEMREMGSILQVIPEVAADGGTINLMLNPQFVRLQEWSKYEVPLAGFGGPAARASVEKPMFAVTSLSTSFRLQSGATVLAGGGACDARTDSVVYLFVTATRVDADGRTLAAPAAAKR